MSHSPEVACTLQRVIDAPSGAAGHPVIHSSRTRLRRLTALAAVIILVAAFLAACGDGGPADADNLHAEVERALGRARERARTADPEGARREFFDGAHDALHRLAAQLAEQDRSRAARVLEAKHAVERSLAEGSPTLADDLDHLIAAVTDARRAGDRRQPHSETNP